MQYASSPANETLKSGWQTKLSLEITMWIFCFKNCPLKINFKEIVYLLTVLNTFVERKEEIFDKEI